MSAVDPVTPARAHWSHERERSNMLALRVMAWIAVRCGRRVARWVLHPIALYFVCFSPAARRHSKRYLARALGRPPHWTDGYRQVHAFASTVLDRVYFARGQIGRFELRVHGAAAIHEALAAGRGAVLVGAHVGSFEALHAAGTQLAALRVAMVMYPDNARMISAVLAALAPGTKLDVIPIGRSGSTLAIRDWLDGGGLAGMLGDRLPPGDDGRGAVTLPFLGAPARFSDGPFRLAQVLRRRVIFMAAVWRGGNVYDVRFEPLADFTQRSDDAAERHAALGAALQAYVARLEALVGDAPYNWFNFHDFWNEG